MVTLLFLNFFSVKGLLYQYLLGPCSTVNFFCIIYGVNEQTDHLLSEFYQFLR